jgi:hypothetical protein
MSGLNNFMNGFPLAFPQKRPANFRAGPPGEKGKRGERAAWSLSGMGVDIRVEFGQGIPQGNEGGPSHIGADARSSKNG